MNKKLLIIFISIVILAVIGGALVFTGKKPAIPATNSPDASDNGANPPNTPPVGGDTGGEPGDGGGDMTASWLAYTDSEKVFSFKYPAAFGANVWRPTAWPPKVTMVAGSADPVAAGCTDIDSKTVTGITGMTPTGITYTLYQNSDIGAGQLYSQYCYVVSSAAVNDYAAVVDFIIQSHSACGFDGCGAYCGTEFESECANLNRSNDIEMPIRIMIETSAFSAAKNQ